MTNILYFSSITLLRPNLIESQTFPHVALGVPYAMNIHMIRVNDVRTSLQLGLTGIPIRRLPVNR